MNYAQLSAAIQAYTENSETTFVANIPLFVEQAEQRIYNSVQIANLRRNVTGVTTTGNKYVAAPDDFLSVYSLAIVLPNGEYRYLLNRDVNYIREVYPSPNEQSVPKYYAIFGPTISGATITPELTFLLGPTPNGNYPLELHYYYYPESIVTAGTTWLGDNFDSALLYGSLVEAYTYMKGDADMMNMYNQKYMEALALLKNLGDGKQRGDAYIDGQVKLPVR